MQVEFITGGTIDRLTKAKINRDHPESDVTVTTSHVGALYVAEGLFEKLDMAKLPNAKDLFPVAIRSPYHIGLYSYVYTPAFRTDLMPAGYDIKSWKDLWAPEVKGKLGLPDFDPSHIIIAAAPARRRQRRELEGRHPAPREAEALDQGLLPVGCHEPGSHEIGRNAGAGSALDQRLPSDAAEASRSRSRSRRREPSSASTRSASCTAPSISRPRYQYLNVALDPEVQAKLCGIYRCGPMNEKAKLDPELAKLPGVFTTPEQWKTQAIVVDDATARSSCPFGRTGSPRT